MNIIHKAGNTLQNADGLSRCATAGDSQADKDIQLEQLEEADEMYLDDIECMQLDTKTSKIATQAIEVKLLQQYTKAYPWSVCSHVARTAKYKQFGTYGEVVHVAFLPSLG